MNSANSEQDQITRNIEAVQGFYVRESGKLSRSQRLLERLTELVGQPRFFIVILVFVCAWIGVDLLCLAMHWPEFDPAPYFWLQGIVGLCAWLTATGVLCTQNQAAKLAEQRANLDLKVTLLTEQKAAKLIDLVEELRRDLPNVKNRQDTHAESLQQSMNPTRVLEALDEHTDKPTPADPQEGTEAAPAAGPEAGSSGPTP
jgi:uncharacterized membrane protein